MAAKPDGMTLDEHDNLYVCCGKAGLKVFDRDARPIGRIEVHAANCCFGAPRFRTLCIASVQQVSRPPHQCHRHEAAGAANLEERNVILSRPPMPAKLGVCHLFPEDFQKRLEKSLGRVLRRQKPGPKRSSRR